ncbi:inverted formin-2-like [Narcine bancroftii]|uniref:inverted formin-2-like n=1 Tax=Narcine bancroftii TaxID=1343680 RepID=UPI003831C7A3
MRPVRVEACLSPHPSAGQCQWRPVSPPPHPSAGQRQWRPVSPPTPVQGSASGGLSLPPPPTPVQGSASGGLSLPPTPVQGSASRPVPQCRALPVGTCLALPQCGTALVEPVLARAGQCQWRPPPVQGSASGAPQWRFKDQGFAGAEPSPQFPHPSRERWRLRPNKVVKGGETPTPVDWPIPGAVDHGNCCPDKRRGSRIKGPVDPPAEEEK